ncbi:glycerophosphodiester phosphodiesterase family protein [Acinetobacter sp. ANC 4648]|uniref:glycerophosphodiester phosphodiesterase family protein n=1 Tax=Acinetobacter sp. ANC 4648 TaxID=1977875 RepID=UPI000A347EF4|nr:glycerophosphodiester phosphodiesterase family protein [Acinetobacter sp. ANC 4648]OTG85075.1 glycerophosphodiester phosphodiesterase [Acinetobacter sp. ANC 4648]
MKLSLFTITLLSIFSIESYAESTKNINNPNVAIASALAKKHVQINFEQQKMIPQGWRVPGNNVGNIFIQDGFLHIDGRKSTMQTTSILLPTELAKLQNYRIDMEFTLDQAVNPSRWGSVIYDIVATQGFIPKKYYQFTVRADTAAKNGTEFGNRKANGQWNVIESKAFPENIKANQLYKATVIVHGNRVQQYLNNVLLQNVELDQPQLNGDIGLSVAGLVMKVKSIQVSEQNTVLPNLNNKVTAVQASTTQVSAAATLIQKMSADLNVNTVSANQVYYHLDAKLNLLDTSGNPVSTLQHYLSNTQRKNIAVLSIQDQQTITVLKQLAKSQDLSDITLLSSETELLQFAHQQLPMIRTALDLSQAKNLSSSRKDLSAVMQMANQAFAKIVVLPKQLIDVKNVRFLQQLLMTVWVDSSATTAQEVASVLTSGVNGIMTTDSAAFDALLKQFPKNTLLRKPFIIGHRGVPSLEDENTLESAKYAVALGADLVENDIYLTKDNHVVVMHDETVNRTTKGTGKIEEMTLAEVQQLRTKNKNYSVPTLAEYFASFKNTQNFVLMIEMKSANPKLVSALKTEIEKYAVEDQVIITSFNRDQIQQVKNHLPMVSTGILIQNMPSSNQVLINSRQILAEAQKYTSSYHPPYRNDLVKLFAETQHRGLTYWPWNLNDTTFKQLYVAGLNGVTTNFVQLYSKYIVDIQAPSELKLKVGQPLKMDVQLQQQDGIELKGQAQQFIILARSPQHETKAGSVSFTQKGTAYVLAGYKYQIDQQYFYHIFSKPVKVIIK